MASPADVDRLTVVCEGTANTLLPITTQLGDFYHLVSATDVSSASAFQQHSPALAATEAIEWKMGFDGCGVTNGISGTIWAFGLGSQCGEVEERVRALLKRGARPVHVTVVGLSRGGIFALLLAKRLGDLIGRMAASASRPELRLALCLYDPVPGNLIGTVKYIDPIFGRLTTAASVLDVSRAPIHRVLALYPYEPLPDLAFHAPLLPSYPEGCEVDEDATLGCHQGALYPPRLVPRSMRDACLLSQERILSFLRECGVPLARHPSALAGGLPQACVDICEAQLRRQERSHRAAHVARGTADIVRHTTGVFLNEHHRRLLAALYPDDPRLGAPSAQGEQALYATVPRFMLEVVRGRA